jgi:hypothetical protein
VGVQQIDVDLYESQIMNIKKDDKPWWIVVLKAGLDKEFWHSTYVMKTLYFLGRDFGDEINLGWINAEDESLLEIFENDGLPIHIYIKEGVGHYQLWDKLGINRFMEFMERYEELRVRAEVEFRAPIKGIYLYPEYYKKAFGELALNIYRTVSGKFQRDYDPEMKYLKKEYSRFYLETFMVHPKKTRGEKFFLYVILPTIFIVLPLIYIIVWRILLKWCLFNCLKKLCCCSYCQEDKKKRE